MLWFLTLTQRCNLHCRYCGGGDSFDIENAPNPIDIQYDPEKVWPTLAQSDPEPVVCFYGGEPLLKMALLKKAVTLFRAHNPQTKFVLQTNGTYLDNLTDDVLLAIGTILVSIDGRPEVTDYYRGKGTYLRVMNQVEAIRSRGYCGDLIARMTVSGHSDLYEEVTHLLSVGVFDHIHWQLDALFDAPMRPDFLSWRDTTYAPGLARLADRFVEEFRGSRGTTVCPLVPFLGVLQSLFQTHGMLQKQPPASGKNARNEGKEKEVPTVEEMCTLLKSVPAVGLRCGSGVNAFTVSTAGQLTACPIAPVFEGCIVEPTIPPTPFPATEELPRRCRAHIDGPCLTCDVGNVCGGRCLVANKTWLWGGDGFDAVCETVRTLIQQCVRIFPDLCVVVQEVGASTVNWKALDYPPYNNSTEIIP